MGPAASDSLLTDTLQHPVRADAAWPSYEPADSAGTWVSIGGSDSISVAEYDSIASSVTFDPVGHLDGIAPRQLSHIPGQSSIVLAIMVALFVGAGCNPAGFRTTLLHYCSELSNVRTRRNAFDEDSGRGGLAIMRVFLFWGAVVVCGICASLLAGAETTASILAGIALAAVFSGFEYSAYMLVGYAFTSREERARWIGGFTASVALTGISVFIPTLLLIFFPEWHTALMWTSLGVFGIFRIVFISKGFRIFYDRISSLLYFILYLCTLEIIPLVAVWKIYKILMNGIF